MDLRRLREQTRTEHEATEAVLPLGSPQLGLETYKATLCAMLPVVEGWETWAAAHAPANVRALLANRRRSHLLKQDMQALGVGPSGLGAAEAVSWAKVVGAGSEAETAFEAGFMGALYVMEGSTLGGRFIARHAEQVLGLQPGRGDAYFRGHEEATGPLWRETTAAIAAVPEEQAELLIAAAKRTFVAFGDSVRRGVAVCTALAPA